MEVLSVHRAVQGFSLTVRFGEVSAWAKQAKPGGMSLWKGAKRFRRVGRLKLAKGPGGKDPMTEFNALTGFRAVEDGISITGPDTSQAVLPSEVPRPGGSGREEYKESARSLAQSA